MSIAELFANQSLISTSGHGDEHSNTNNDASLPLPSVIRP